MHSSLLSQLNEGPRAQGPRVTSQRAPAPLVALMAGIQTRARHLAQRGGLRVCTPPAFWHEARASILPSTLTRRLLRNGTTRMVRRLGSAALALLPTRASSSAGPAGGELPSQVDVSYEAPAPRTTARDTPP